MVHHWLRRFPALLACCALALLLAPLGLAQTSNASIHVIVRDPSGAVIPAAKLTLTNTATGNSKAGQAGADGTFVFPNLQPGTYAVTSAATGFQKAVYSTVAVSAGLVTDLAVQMKLGSATQTVEVTAAPPELKTSTNTVSTTINAKAITDLPYASRDSLDFAELMAGAQSGSGGEDFNNLPNASLNITLNGMNNNSQRFKSGGTSFYTFAPERINATDQVTVTTAGKGANLDAGAMSIAFTTKRGTDQYHVSAGWQFENWALNSNSFFNNLRGQPISHRRQNNPYVSVGGPVIPWSSKWRHKLFFFAYFESQPQPSSSIDTTTVLTPAAQLGNFTYIGTDGTTRTVNLLQAAAAGGINNTAPDPTVSKMLGSINSSEKLGTGLLPITGQPYWQTLQWNQPSSSTQYFPTGRIDYDITPNMKLHSSVNLRNWNIPGSAPPYPGETQYAFGNAYKINTYVWNTAFDWTLTPNLINSASFGKQSNAETFYQGATPQQWAPYGNRQIYSNLISTTIPNYFQANVLPFIRNNPVYQFRDDLTWTHGRHTFRMGGQLMHTSFYETSYGGGGVPVYSLGLSQGDPAANVLQSALPDVNVNNGDLSNADNLFALLTGRVSSIYGFTNVDETTHKYAEYQAATQRWAFTSGNLYFSDSFQMTSNFTLNYGLNWMFNGPVKSTNGIDGEPDSLYGPSTGLFQPGQLSANTNPQFVQVGAPYKSDLVNPAPSLGFAWNPQGGSGLWGKLLGHNKTVFRGGYALNFYNEGMNTISNPIADNPGATQTNSSFPGSPGFTAGGLNLTSPAPTFSQFPAKFGYPMPESEFALSGQGIGYINPNLKTPYTQSWSFGIQRELPANTVIEVRYMGNKSTHMWHFQNLDETNIFENGFLTQFQQAQKNLTINNAAGANTKGYVPTFANQGLPGEAATPIFDAAFGGNGSYGPLSGSQGYANSNFIIDLQQGVAGSMAGALGSTAGTYPGYYCRMVGSNFSPCASNGFTAAGAYPLNFFNPNPYVTSLNYQDDNGDNNYNALQVDVRKTFSHGLTYQANFTWSHSLGDIFNSNDQTATSQWFTYRNARLNYGPTPFDHRFAWNSFWTYDLPMGRGQWFDPGHGLDRIFGGWTLGGTEQIATGAPFLLTSGRNTFNDLSDGGVVLGNGLTTQQLQQALSTIPNQSVTVSGRALMSNVANYASSSGAANPTDYAPASTPGAFGQLIYLRNTPSVSLNMSLNKSILLLDRLHLNFRMEDLNFLNHPFFALGNSSVTSNRFGQVTSASGTRTILLRTSLSW